MKRASKHTEKRMKQHEGNNLVYQETGEGGRGRVRERKIQREGDEKGEQENIIRERGNEGERERDTVMEGGTDKKVRQGNSDGGKSNGGKGERERWSREKAVKEGKKERGLWIVEVNKKRGE